MKKTIVWIAMIVLISACACKVEAGWFGKKKETPKEITTSSASTDKTKAGAPEQKKQPEQKKEAEVKKIDKEQQKAAWMRNGRWWQKNAEGSIIPNGR